MFKKKKKQLPSGTFIPTSKRLLVIMQLCLAFSLILWYVAQPFMGEYFALRSRMLLYEYAMGSSEILKSKPDNVEKLEQNAKRFAALPERDYNLLTRDYQILQGRALRPTLTKVQDGLQALFLKIPPFELAWLVFSCIIAILLLLKTDGAIQAAWLLPLITLAYGVDNRINGRIIPPSADLALFPTESFIIQGYLKEPLKTNWAEQQVQLQEGWQRYLVQNWTQETTGEKDWKDKVEEGEFNFTIARLHKIHSQLERDWISISNEKVTYLILGFYLTWNLFFAWIVNRPLKRQFYAVQKMPNFSS